MQQLSDWTPLVKSSTSNILDRQTILLVTDEENRWFSRYVLSKINSINSGRPLLPYYALLSIYPNLSDISILDIKLIQLYKLFDMTIEASLFSELELKD
ncbi:MAG: hypothetical protein JJV88_02770 [Sulfurovum sp.]|nr:hypothetical protein [Sulfurovaceae bacterium]